jgi:hypothetical protein
VPGASSMACKGNAGRTSAWVMLVCVRMAWAMVCLMPAQVPGAVPSQLGHSCKTGSHMVAWGRQGRQLDIPLSGEDKR